MSETRESFNHALKLIQDATTNPLRRAYLLQKLIREEKVSKKELARLINKSPSYISNYLRLLTLPEVIKDALLSGMITEGHCRALSFMEEQQEALRIFEDVVRHNYSVRETEREVGKARKYKREYGRVAENIRGMATGIAGKYNISVKVQRKRRHIFFTLAFPLGVVGFRQLKKMADRLLD